MNKLIAAFACALAVPALAAGGNIGGTIAFSGTAPKVEKLNRKSDPVCAKKDFNDPSIVLSKDGKSLGNVVVRITKNAPAGTKAPEKPITIDQHDCMYEPHIQVAVEGQKIDIKNSDPTLHNIHAYAGTKTLFNQAQPAKSKDIEKEAKDGDVIRLQCDVHPWMKGFIVMSKTPFAAVSDENGKFEIKDVPAGTYTVEAWHEKYGTQTAEVKVEDGKTADPKFTFSDKKS